MRHRDGPSPRSDLKKMSFCFYLDAKKALEYGLIDAILAGQLSVPKPAGIEMGEAGERPDAGRLDGDEPADAEAPAVRLAMRATGGAGTAGGAGAACEGGGLGGGSV